MLEFYRSKDLEDGRRGASQSFKRMQNRFRAHMKTEYDLTLLRKYEKTGIFHMSSIFHMFNYIFIDYPVDVQVSFLLNGTARCDNWRVM